MQVIFAVAACASVLAVALICIFLFANGIPAMSKIGFGKFLTGELWRPKNDIYGIFPMIVGSLYVTAGAIIIGVPIGILTAVFMAFYCPKAIYRPLKMATELLAGIPSVVYGFFGLVVLVPWVREIGRSLHRGGPRTVASARALAVQTGAVVAVSGPIDVLTDGKETILLHNGCATMSRVTGSGCMLTALMGAFCGAMPGQPFAAACAAAATMGVAGELAEARRLAHGTGNATFRTDLIDAVFNLTPAQLDASVRWESYSK